MVRDVGHVGVVSGLAGSFVDEWGPGVVVDVELEEGGVDLGGGAGHYGEPDVAGPTGVNEPGAPGRVGPHPDLALNEVTVVAGVVPGGDAGRQLGDGLVQDGLVSAMLLAAALPGRNTAASASPVASASRTSGGTRTPA